MRSIQAFFISCFTVASCLACVAAKTKQLRSQETKKESDANLNADQAVAQEVKDAFLDYQQARLALTSAAADTQDGKALEEIDAIAKNVALLSHEELLERLQKENLETTQEIFGEEKKKKKPKNEPLKKDENIYTLAGSVLVVTGLAARDWINYKKDLENQRIFRALNQEVELIEPGQTTGIMTKQQLLQQQQQKQLEDIQLEDIQLEDIQLEDPKKVYAYEVLDVQKITKNFKTKEQFESLITETRKKNIALDIIDRQVAIITFQQKTKFATVPFPPELPEILSSPEAKKYLEISTPHPSSSIYDPDTPIKTRNSHALSFVLNRGLVIIPLVISIFNLSQRNLGLTETEEDTSQQPLKDLMTKLESIAQKISAANVTKGGPNS